MGLVLGLGSMCGFVLQGPFQADLSIDWAILGSHNFQG